MKCTLREKFEDNKGKSEAVNQKDRHHNDQMKKDKSTNDM